jgi:hypothetical protein
MSATEKTKDRKWLGRKWLYRACNCRGALEIYLQPFADAQRFSSQLESKAAQLERETSDESEWSALERPFFDKGGFGGKKLHRSTVGTLIDLARENARVFFPQGLQYDKEGRLIYGLYGKVSLDGQWPGEKTLSRIAGDRFVILAYQAILEPNGDFFRVIAEVIEEDAKPLKEILGRALRYQVELVHKAILELVDEAHKRDRAARSNGNTQTVKEEPHDVIDGRRCFVPTKQQVKDRAIEIFQMEEIPERTGQEWTKPNPKEWSDSTWTKVFAAGGLANLREERGLHRAKGGKAAIARHSKKKGRA